MPCTVPLIRAEVDLVTRALTDLLSMSKLDLMPMVCIDCGRLYEVKDAEGRPGVGHGICCSCDQRREGAHAH